MKKIYIVLLLLVLGAGTANAQLSFGVKGGLNFGTFSSLPDGVDNDGSRIGIVLGAYTRFKIPVVGLFVQPELIFSQKGGKQTAGGITATTSVNNIDIPILVGGSLGPVRLAIGPVFGFPIGAKSEVAGISVDILENVNSPLAGLQIGAGISIPGTKLGFDLRYELGLTKIVDNAVNNDTKLNLIQFTVSYGIL